MKSVKLISILMVGCIALIVKAQENPLIKVVQLRLDSLRDSSGFPGATVSVIGDQYEFTLATGFSNLEENIPMKPNDAMLGGSIGKTFVAAMILRLVEEGKINLDGRIGIWLEGHDWFDSIDNNEFITLRMLLNHTSGLPEYLKESDFLVKLKKNPFKNWTPAERLSYLNGGKLLFSPGTKFSYSDTNYILAGIIIEEVLDSTYDVSFAHMLSEIGLKSTAPSNSRKLPGLITGYSKHIDELGLAPLGEGIIINGIPLTRMLTPDGYAFNPQLEWTAGGLLTTSRDLALWAKYLFEGKYISSDYLELMLENKKGRSNAYGLGVQLRHSGHWGYSYGHSGWMPGYHSDMEYFPDHRIAIAVQVNTDDTQLINPRQIVFEVMEILIKS